MPSFVWIALGAFALALVSGSVWTGVNARRALKRGLPAFERMTQASQSLVRRSSELERHVAELQPKVARLQRERARLERSVARARVLFGAVQEVRTVYRIARIFGP